MIYHSNNPPTDHLKCTLQCYDYKRAKRCLWNTRTSVTCWLMVLNIPSNSLVKHRSKEICAHLCYYQLFEILYYIYVFALKI